MNQIGREKTHDNLGITKHENFTKDSFAFGKRIMYEKFGTEKIRLTTSKGKTLLLFIPDCLSYEVKKKGKFPILYVKLDDETVFFEENGELIGHREYRDRWFRSDVIVRIESLYVNGDNVSVQIKLHEVRVKPDRSSGDSVSDFGSVSSE
ncbi:Hypothetical predicted protein [Paramuricea clavata]|uniref:Uncharacterized protein n=1 Tax=Paramuricea clavata TaxID=317549 RepID=A0A7D9IEJ1_PARCT|nr:Hypothetical predicted protein [Paramuricea clavata]